MGSTLSMCDRYLKIDSVLRTAHDKIVNDKVRVTGKGPADPLTPVQRHTVINLTAVLRNVEESTSSLGKSSAPTSQDADVFAAGIIAALDNLLKDTEETTLLSKLATTLKDDILHRRRDNLKQCSMQQLVFMVATFLTPLYKSMGYRSYLGGHEAYTCQLDLAVFYLYNVSCCFFDEKSSSTRASNMGSARNSSTRGQGAKKMRKLITAAFCEDIVGAQVDEQEKVKHEMQVYLANAEFNTDDNGEVIEEVLSFWDRSETFYPRLAKVARFVFTALTCSTESERVFSTAGLKRQKERSRLSGTTAELIILVGRFMRTKYAVCD